MEFVLRGEPKEIAAFVVGLQERQFLKANLELDGKALVNPIEEIKKAVHSATDGIGPKECK